MSFPLSADTKAILLLTAPLISGPSNLSYELFSPGEYKRLVRQLLNLKRRPADLLATDNNGLIDECAPIADANRMRRLLDRGFLLAQVVERWQTRAIWVVSRADSDYPRRLKERLREDAPPVIYGCGDRGLLEAGGLAVVGSRNADEMLLKYAANVGKLTALANRTLVSGGARGVDQAAMSGALEAGGTASGVLADSLEKATLNREYRNRLLKKQLVLISPYDPNAGFNKGHAMQRNKLIYALADSSLIVNSDLEKGGTWAGAVEQLDKLRFVPVHVRSTGESSTGLEALLRKGAIPWPNPSAPATLEHILESGILASAQKSPSGPSLFPGLVTSNAHARLDSGSLAEAETPNGDHIAVLEPSDIVKNVTKADPSLSATQHSVSNPPGLSTSRMTAPAENLFSAVREITRSILTSPMKEAEIAEALGVSKSQVKEWLRRLLEEKIIEKHKNSYTAQQSTLFK